MSQNLSSMSPEFFGQIDMSTLEDFSDNCKKMSTYMKSREKSKFKTSSAETNMVDFYPSKVANDQVVSHQTFGNSNVMELCNIASLDDLGEDESVSWLQLPVCH